MKQVKIYFKSDFSMMLASKTKWNDAPFRLNFYTNESSRGYVASWDGERWANCHLQEDGRLCIAFDKHGLGVGKMMVEARFYLDNSCFNDGTCMKVVTPFVPVFTDTDGTDYELILALDGDELLEVIGTLPPFWQKPRFEDFSEEEIKKLQKPAIDAAEEIRKEDARRNEVFEQKKAESEEATANAKAATAAAQASVILANEKAQAAEEAASKADTAAGNATQTAADISSQFVTNEQKRQQQFVQAQNMRQQSYVDAETSRQQTFSESEKQRQFTFENEEAKRSDTSADAIEKAKSATAAATASASKADEAAGKADTATANAKAATAAAQVQTDLAQELNEHPQKIGDNGNWWKWNSQSKEYEDTGVIARGGAMYPTFLHEGNKLYMNDYGSNVQERIVKEDNALILLI